MSGKRWTATSIGEVIELQRGYDITKANQRPGVVPVISSGGVSSYHDEAAAVGPGVVIGRKGTLGRVFYEPGPYWPHDTTLWVRDFKGSHPRFVFYFLQTLDFEFMNVGSANPTLNRNHVHPLPVSWPPVKEQRAIAEVLGALDDKIAANRRVVGIVAHYAEALVARAVGAGSTRVRVEEIASFHNRRRVPLSKNQRAGRTGDVPYYGATGIVDWVDEPIFAEPLVLVGEDGTVVTESGTAVVQYVWGPVWVNNHAHVLTGVGVSTQVLRHLLARTSVAEVVTGAVQAKLSMGNLRSVEVDMPSCGLIEELEAAVAVLTAREVAAIEEIQRLAATRDELLPLLMSGRITVRDAEQRVEQEV